MIVACSACSHRFEGGGYRDETCPACGAIALATRSCPLCSALLAARRSQQLVIDHCATCGGVFVDHPMLESILANLGLVGSLLTYLPRRPISDEETLIRRCASCTQDMQQRMWPGGAGAIVDVCVPHGVFFDAGELHRLVEHARREEREAASRRAEDELHAQKIANSVYAKMTDMVDAIDHFVRGFLDKK
jgi:Zn-finger nucleic acid-binding protein